MTSANLAGTIDSLKYICIYSLEPVVLRVTQLYNSKICLVISYSV